MCLEPGTKVDNIFDALRILFLETNEVSLRIRGTPYEVLLLESYGVFLDLRATLYRLFLRLWETPYVILLLEPYKASFLL